LPNRADRDLTCTALMLRFNDSDSGMPLRMENEPMTDDCIVSLQPGMDGTRMTPEERLKLIQAYISRIPSLSTTVRYSKSAIARMPRPMISIGSSLMIPC
jgi:hypothetical protein